MGRAQAHLTGEVPAARTHERSRQEEQVAHVDVPPPASSGQRPRRSDRSAWNWLLLVPLVVTLYPPLYNRTDPQLIGIPFFYWYQLAIISAGVACTYLVHRRTRG